MSTAFNMALGTGVILGFGSLSLDLGYANFARTQVHAAADAAAIAGAISVLNDQPNGTVVSSAAHWGEANSVGSVDVTVDNVDIRRGTWDGTAFVDSTSGRDVWARAHTEGTSAFLSRIWGQSDLDTSAISIARAEPPTVCTVIGVDAAEVGGNGNVYGYDSSVSLDPALSADPTAGICSNNVVIDIFGNAVIDANVRPGVNGIVDITGNAEVTGNTAALPLELQYPAVTFPSGATTWPYGTSIRSTVNAAAGTYKITSVANPGFVINANGQVVVNGPTTLYINGDMTLNGSSFVNTTGDPHNLKIYVIGDHDVKINGDTAFYGLVYAPTSEVVVSGTGDFYGGIISAEVDFSGTGNIYMDTSLMDNVIKGGVKLIR